MTERVYINEKYRTFLKEWDEKDILDFHTSKAIDIFLIAVALGLDEPQERTEKKDGYFQTHNNVHTYEKALFGSILLGKNANAKDIEKYANEDANYIEAERCAETGFLKLKEKIDAASADKDLLDKRLLNELNLLYIKNVASNL